MLSGFIITAIVVDNVQKRFTASAHDQKTFYAIRARIQLFLRRQHAPNTIFQRVNSFLDFWWSSHRGGSISQLLADLPAQLRQDILRSICAPALQTLGLLANVGPSLQKLEDFFVSNVQFILYGQGEVVYRQGDYANGIFFLLEGEVCVIANAQNPRGVPCGGYFGTACLKPQSHAEGYGEHVSATKGCILLFMSRAHLSAMESIFPGLGKCIVELEDKLLASKLMLTDLRASTGRGSERRGRSSIQQAQNHTQRWKLLFSGPATAIDPDSHFVHIWEVWLFIAMTVQWLTATVQICFRMKKARYIQADDATAVLDLSFFLDMILRKRLGLYAFGNKIMSPTFLFPISHLYRRPNSLTPLYVINWFRPPQNHLDGLNINKIIRVFKVPGQLRALENRNLKHTTELRLFKLFYYTFLLACIRLHVVRFCFKRVTCTEHIWN